MLKAISITVCGEVKGVGFRKYIWRYAKLLGLKGYVENLVNSDCAEIYAEGEEHKINELLNKILQNRIFTIRHVDAVEQEYRGIYTDFNIVKCMGEEEV